MNSTSHADQHLKQQGALALSYARNEWSIFPACPRSKRPLTPNGHLGATSDTATVYEWWRRTPNALVAMPTGHDTGLWVLDVDGPIGRTSLTALMAELGMELLTELSPVVVETPGGGLHLYFRLGPGETPRSRASDIGAGLDTRGEGGYIIVPGNVLPDGRCYQSVGSCFDLMAAFEAPRKLVYLATFSARDRAEIESDSSLKHKIRAAEACRWREVLDSVRSAKAERFRGRLAVHPLNEDGMRRQAVHDLKAEVERYAALTDGRRNQLFSAGCRLGKYAAHGVLAVEEISDAFVTAAAANGALTQYGAPWLRDTMRRALEKASSDALPLLSRQFREGRV